MKNPRNIPEEAYDQTANHRLPIATQNFYLLRFPSFK